MGFSFGGTFSTPLGMTNMNARRSVSRLASSHFQLPVQNPMEQGEQPECRSNQNDRVEDKDADLNAEKAFFYAEENVWPIAAAVIALFHLGV
jgi:hypothetical protein